MRTSNPATVGYVVIACVLTCGGCALSRQRAAVDTPNADTRDRSTEPPVAGTPKQKEADTNAASQLAAAPQRSPWSIFTAVRNAFTSNVNFDQESVDSYGTVLATGVHFDGDAFEFSYEIAGHEYTSTNRWNRVSHAISASFEQDLPGHWDLKLGGAVGFKGSSEDRDLVDQDFEISPRLQYRFNAARRLRLLTKHRVKRFNDAPDRNAIKHYVGVEFLETLRPRHYVEVGGRFETNDERRDKSDSRRWTYWVVHGIPITGRDALVLGMRYRLKRYTHRFVEVKNEDVLRVDHRWTPSITWVRTVGKFDLRFDYTYETTYSNDPEKEYQAHVAWTSVGYRWK